MKICVGIQEFKAQLKIELHRKVRVTLLDYYILDR